MNYLGIIRSIACAICRATGGEVEEPQYPAPPLSLGRIDANRVRYILRQWCPNAHIEIGDWDLELTSVEECERFLKYYHDKHPYTYDEYDCDKYAWLQRGEAIKWMDGKFSFGYIEAQGKDAKYRFNNHGFNFIIDFNEKVHICDELEVAAPADKFVEAYEVEASLLID